MLIAAHATGASRGIIYLRYEYPETLDILGQALSEAEEKGYTGHCKLYIRRGAGAYICGEEGSLLNSLEGKHPFPAIALPTPPLTGLRICPPWSTTWKLWLLYLLS